MQSIKRSRLRKVNTLPLVAISIFFMSSRRTPNPRPAMQAITSYFGLSGGCPAMLSANRCWIRVALSRAVPSSSVIFASMMIRGLNSLGTMKSGVWSKPGILSARLVFR